MVNKANPDQLKELVLSLMEARKKAQAPREPSPAKSLCEGLRRSSSATPPPQSKELPAQSKPPPEQPSGPQPDEDSPTTRKFQKDLQAAIDEQDDANQEEEEREQEEEKEQEEGDDTQEWANRDPYRNANATSHRKEWMAMDRRMQAADAKAKWPEFHKLWEAGRDASCCKVCRVSRVRGLRSILNASRA